MLRSLPFVLRQILRRYIDAEIGKVETQKFEAVEESVNATNIQKIIRHIHRNSTMDPHMSPAIAIPLPSTAGSFFSWLRAITPRIIAGIEHMAKGGRKLAIPRTRAAIASPLVLRVGAAVT